MRILIDMNLSPQWALFLQSRGFDALHWSSIGSPSASDEEVLAYAEASGFVIFTHDLDFGMLLAARGSSRPSVVQTRTQDVLPSALGSTLIRLIETTRNSLESGALVSLDDAGQRIRILPI